eukprot:TRINITY_DN15608_c0_g1_i1.p1 TRINITY_DN15608_c0_g1~~TRINITY_DN15608_c0_g1_i1.p1  ORF type:complete len:61 (-),score=5.19 TRINITY_DN15608_c0_g1_i1:238-420(-)
MMDITTPKEDEQKVLILDSRSQKRFSGEVSEPGPVKRLGHMPGAINIPYTELLQSDATTL